MARSKIIYTLKEIADMIGENLELLEESPATLTISPRARWSTSVTEANTVQEA